MCHMTGYINVIAMHVHEWVPLHMPELRVYMHVYWPRDVVNLGLLMCFTEPTEDKSVFLPVVS